MSKEKNLAIIYRTKNKVDPWRIDMKRGSDPMYAFNTRFPTFADASSAIRWANPGVEIEKIGEGE